MLWCWAWSRILITSIGVTTATASVIPAARPAKVARSVNGFFSLSPAHCKLVKGTYRKRWLGRWLHQQTWKRALFYTIHKT